jgi:probable biosynthetic protein (TIGR04098 family)
VSRPANTRILRRRLDISPFLTEYSTIRSEYGRRKGEHEPAPSDLYSINPYTDSNGANLLYFAAYQNISDFLTLRRYPDESDVFMKRRDIYYFRNSDLTDAIYLEPVSRTGSATGRMDGQNLLFSASDGSCLAYTTTIKEAG